MTNKVKVRKRVITYVDEMLDKEDVKHLIVEAKVWEETGEIDLYKRSNDYKDFITRCATIPAPPEPMESGSDELLEYARNNIPDNIDFT